MNISETLNHKPLHLTKYPLQTSVTKVFCSQLDRYKVVNFFTARCYLAARITILLWCYMLKVTNQNFVFSGTTENPDTIWCLQLKIIRQRPDKSVSALQSSTALAFEFCLVLKYYIHLYLTNPILDI